MLGSLRTIKPFHVSTQDCSCLSRLPPPGSPPATANRYQSDPDCFDTKHQFHSLSFHRQINYSSSLQGQREFSHQKGNFHSLGLSLAQEGKTKTERQEGALLDFSENGHKFPPWDTAQRDGMSLSPACGVPGAGFRLPESSPVSLHHPLSQEHQGVPPQRLQMSREGGTGWGCWR